MSEGQFPKPPKRPWKKGRHGGYETIVVEVEVCKDSLGRVFSYHALQSEEDESIVMSWPSGGTEQVAFALLTEATRREAILDFLIHMSRDAGYLDRLREMSEKEQKSELQRIERAMKATMNNGITRIANAVVEEVFDNFLKVTKPS